MARAGGEEWKAAAMAPAAAPAVVRPKPSFADCVFRFCMEELHCSGDLIFSYPVFYCGNESSAGEIMVAAIFRCRCDSPVLCSVFAAGVQHLVIKEVDGSCCYATVGLL
ncbi:hypothetical protein ACP70R_015328 [Stipagrostis hirtigluma subsp. patula]